MHERTPPHSRRRLWGGVVTDGVTRDDASRLEDRGEQRRKPDLGVPRASSGPVAGASSGSVAGARSGAVAALATVGDAQLTAGQHADALPTQRQLVVVVGAHGVSPSWSPPPLDRAHR